MNTNHLPQNYEHVPGLPARASVHTPASPAFPTSLWRRAMQGQSLCSDSASPARSRAVRSVRFKFTHVYLATTIVPT